MVEYSDPIRKIGELIIKFADIGGATRSAVDAY